MIDCEKATNLITARIDGEIASADQAILDSHLSGCPACRATMEALSAQDADLQRAFAPRQAAAALAARSALREIRRDRLAPRRLPWLAVLLSAAAGFALALLILRPWVKPPLRGQIAQTQPSSTPAIAHLALATGAIEVLPPRSADWQPLATGAAIPAGTRVRTAPRVRGEFKLADGSVLRLNGNTDLLFNSPRTFDLATGQIWSNVSISDIPFTIAAAQATITALGTQFDLLARPEEARLTVIQGTARVTDKSGARLVESGKQVSIARGEVGKEEFVQNLATVTNWVNELIMLKGHDNAELRSRVDALLAQIGDDKMTYLLESEIRALGDHCVLPLARFIQSDLSKQPGPKYEYRRRKAAEILADMAQPWSIPELIKLLEDPDDEVRYQTARGLKRIAGTDQGVSPEQWRTNLSPTRARETIAKWRQWWESKKDRYPAGPMLPM